MIKSIILENNRIEKENNRIGKENNKNNDLILDKYKNNSNKSLLAKAGIVTTGGLGTLAALNAQLN
jgi:hypothetical protein